MPGTKHFTRMQYNVSRGMREIIAPRQTMSKADWKRVLEDFNEICVFCGSEGTTGNRGIVPDHLIPATQFGELVLGNTVPACQTCNDSRGEKDWRLFLNTRFPSDAETRIAKVEEHLAKYHYCPPTPENSLSADEREAYLVLVQQWESMLAKAKKLHAAAKLRRKSSA